MARAEAYPHTKFYLDPSKCLAIMHQRHRQTDRQDDGPIADGEPFYKRSPKNWGKLECQI